MSRAGGSGLFLQGGACLLTPLSGCSSSGPSPGSPPQLTRIVHLFVSLLGEMGNLEGAREHVAFPSPLWEKALCEFRQTHYSGILPGTPEDLRSSPGETGRVPGSKNHDRCVPQDCKPQEFLIPLLVCTQPPAIHGNDQLRVPTSCGPCGSAPGGQISAVILQIPLTFQMAE